MKSSSLLLGVSTFPVACYVTLLASAAHTRFTIGHWPSYNNPDPHHLPIYFVASIAALTGLIGVAVCPLLMLIIIAVRGKHSAGDVTVGGVCYMAGAILWALDFFRWRVGSGGLVNWIFD